MPATISYDNSVPWRDHSQPLLRDSSSCVHSQSIGLLQRSTVRSVWQADMSPTVSPERCCATCYRCTAMRPHNSDPATTTLAAHATARTVQDRCPRLSMSSRRAPSYLSDDCQPVSDSRPRRLRSCVVRRAHNTYGERCFATAGPRVWNSLPAELQQCSSLRQFKRCLKTFLFGPWDYGALWLFVKQRRIEIVLLTYLLTFYFNRRR